MLSPTDTLVYTVRVRTLIKQAKESLVKDAVWVEERIWVAGTDGLQLISRSGLARISPRCIDLCVFQHDLSGVADFRPLVPTQWRDYS